MQQCLRCSDHVTVWLAHSSNYRRMEVHSGMDIGYEEGTAIPAMMPGTVVYSAWYDGYGYTVILEHENGDHTLYGHCSALYCNYGQYVEKGTVIAAVGSTGYSTGPHLHLEYWHNNQYTDPQVLWN